MRIVFWLSIAIILYAQVGYACWLYVVARLRPKRIATSPMTPTVSILMACRNAEEHLGRKLANLAALDYPADRVQIVIVSDGSTDATREVLERSPMNNLTPVFLETPLGKAAALNQAVRVATGEIFVLFDVRQQVDTDAVRKLCSCFADADVGAVSGELLLEDENGRPSAEALGLYWRLEKTIRKLESDTGSVIGATGAIYAVRRELFKELPEGTILDDVLVPMNVAHAGKRVIFLPSAHARDRIFQEPGKEFARKVRTLTGNYQLLQLAPWLLTPSNPLLFRFVSHKLLRLLVPYLLIVLLVSSALAHGLFYRGVFFAQLVVYCLAVIGRLQSSWRRFRVVAISETFTMLNIAAALALYNFATRRKNVWV